MTIHSSMPLLVLPPNLAGSFVRVWRRCNGSSKNTPHNEFGVSSDAQIVKIIKSVSFLFIPIMSTTPFLVYLLCSLLGQEPLPFSYSLDQGIPCPRGSNQDSVRLYFPFFSLKVCVAGLLSNLTIFGHLCVPFSLIAMYTVVGVRRRRKANSVWR